MCSLSLRKIIFCFSIFITGQTKAFTICAEPDNLPISDRESNSGYEVEVARHLAKKLGEELTVKWIPQRDHAYFRKTIEAGACDAIMGIPSDFKRLSTTSPWYRTGFVFVTNTEEIVSFDHPKLKKLKIGVPSTGLGPTPPIMALTKRSLEKNLHYFSVYEQNLMLDALKQKKVDVAILWGPFAGWFGKDEKKFFLHPLTKEDGAIPLSFDFSIGIKKGNEKLRDRLNIAINGSQAEIQRILKKWHVPMREN